MRVHGQVHEAHVDRPEFLESFRGRLNQSWSIERNVGLVIDSVFHAVDESRDRFDLSRNSNFLPTVNSDVGSRLRV